MRSRWQTKCYAKQGSGVQAVARPPGHSQQLGSRKYQNKMKIHAVFWFFKWNVCWIFNRCIEVKRDYSQESIFGRNSQLLIPDINIWRRKAPYKVINIYRINVCLWSCFLSCATRHRQVFSSANVTIQMTTELQSSHCRLGTRIAQLCKGFGKYFPRRGLERGREWSD